MGQRVAEMREGAAAYRVPRIEIDVRWKYAAIHCILQQCCENYP